MENHPTAKMYVERKVCGEDVRAGEPSWSMASYHSTAATRARAC